MRRDSAVDGPVLPLRRQSSAELLDRTAREAIVRGICANEIAANQPRRGWDVMCLTSGCVRMLGVNLKGLLLDRWAAADSPAWLKAHRANLRLRYEVLLAAHDNV